ncbi:hypothetical protein E8E12_002269 [Didymella heteroderae]|uniref:Chromatin binding n=1 Tax=Didymella heteroderae TaxID=1769908 RepID=A0A9P4WGV4_9PLEO|nr:hypothetical protein E8E12_002269 [Didymella heteroderae]
MDIRLIIEPHLSESPAGKNSLAPLARDLAATRPHSTTPLAYTVSCSHTASQATPAANGQTADRTVQTSGSASSAATTPVQLTLLGSSCPRVIPEPRVATAWSSNEDNLMITLRGQRMEWADISKHIPGRSSVACRLRYQNYLEKKAMVNEENKNKLAQVYARLKDQMWQKVATEMGVPWRMAESLHWQLGENEMSERAKASMIQSCPTASSRGCD